MSGLTRRRVLATAAATVFAGLAGCTPPGEDDMKCVGDCEHVESLGADNQSFYITFSQPWSGKIVIRAYRRDDGDELTAAAEVEVTDRTAVGIPLQSKILSNHVVWTLTARDQGSEREVSGS